MLFRSRLMDDVPLWPAAAIHRGPSTVAILNSSTSQNPMVLRSWDLESGKEGAEIVMGRATHPVEIQTARGIIMYRTAAEPALVCLPPVKKADLSPGSAGSRDGRASRPGNIPASQQLFNEVRSAGFALGDSCQFAPPGEQFGRRHRRPRRRSAHRKSDSPARCRRRG